MTFFIITRAHQPWSCSAPSGTKLGCGEGGCGACTVTVAQFASSDDAVVHRAVPGSAGRSQLRWVDQLDPPVDRVRVTSPVIDGTGVSSP